MTRPALPELPITDALPQLTAALSSRTCVLLQASPGAGKSTLVPLALLRDGAWLASRKILMLEPRRIAARAVAQRMASLLGEPVGWTVGYRTRLDTRVSRDTRIEVVTEGILTRMLQEDPELPTVGCVIFDEFHERSLQADLGLALCLECQETLRTDLRIVVMSATLDLEPLARLLHDAPIVTAQGRSFTVATHYVPRRVDIAMELQLAQVVRRALDEHDGDVLCFLPGAAEIGRLQRTLAGMDLPRSVRLLPLYADLSAAAQDAALAPASAGERKIVLATTLAETSLTIQGVRIVVDCGQRRYAEFDPASGMSHLVTAKISQAAADQRRGRAGRLSSGVCYRLWSEGAHASLAAQTPPEIIHADLAPLALDLACWGAADPATMRWLDPPPPGPLAQARDILRRLEATDASGRVTAHGRALARIGTHPRLAHMLVSARGLRAPRLACDLAAILSGRDLLRAARGKYDADLRLRLGAMHGEAMPDGIEIDVRALTEARRNSADWQRQFAAAIGEDADPDFVTGALVALAYPDRISRARPGGARYVMANGRGARFAEPQALSKSPYLVAAHLDGADREARILLAAPLREEDLLQLFAAHISEWTGVRWDERAEAVAARRERRFGSIVLRDSELTDPDPDDVYRAVLTGVRGLGIAALPWSMGLRQFQARVDLMRRQHIPADIPWPDLSDIALEITLEEWIAPWIGGMTRREHFARLDLSGALRSRLSRPQSLALETGAPTHWTVPSGSQVPIDYLDGDVPAISVRLQELFGLRATPCIAAGRVPLLLKILSPAGRPVQVTRDLASFWSRGYHDVRKDLKGRYPKHYWPDDPYAAQATRRPVRKH